MAGESPSYLDWLRQQPCCACGRAPAGEAHHTGRKGMGQRPDDDQAVPLCHECHMDLHALTGAFRGFEKRHIRTWEAMAVRDALTLYANLRAGAVSGTEAMF